MPIQPRGQARLSPLGRRQSTGGIPSHSEDLRMFADDERAVIKNAIGHITQSHVSAGFHKWCSVVGELRFQELTVKARWIYDNKFEKDACASKDYDLLCKWVHGSCPGVFYKSKKGTLRHLVVNSHFKRFEEGEPLFYQSQHGKYYYIVLTGSVDIYVNYSHQKSIETFSYFQHNAWKDVESGEFKERLGNCVHTVYCGGGFGEVALNLTRPMRSATAIASMETEVLMVPKDIYKLELGNMHKASDNFEDRIQFLKHKTDIFSNWAYERLVQLSYAIKEEEFSRGSVIERQGDPIDEFRILVKGEVEVKEKTGNSGSHTVALKSKGTFIGSMDAVHGHKQPFTIVAHTNVLLYHIPRGAYEKIVSKAVIGGVAAKRVLQDMETTQVLINHKHQQHYLKMQAKFPVLYNTLNRPTVRKIKPLGKIEGSKTAGETQKDETKLSYQELVDAVARDDQGFPPKPIPPPAKGVARLPWASGDDVSNWENYKERKTHLNGSDMDSLTKLLEADVTIRGKSAKKKKGTGWRLDPPEIIPRTLEFMETKFSTNNPVIREALQRR